MGFFSTVKNISDLKNLSDEEILSLSITKPSVFSELLDRYQNAFLRKAQSVVHNKEDAEDIVQDAFTKIYLNASKFEIRENGSFKAWGYKILLNTSFTKYQKLKKERGVTAALDPEIYQSLPDLKSDEFGKQETREYILSILIRMPEHLGRALRLHFLEGKPQQEIAEIEGVSIGAVKTRVHRAKKEFERISTSLQV